ncbi:ringv domain containing protein [Stylonychia lemnae]|uniref:Ringv domain containing protein n=1 Tax=Stylonychia lemnae TaxID=5949 RepID=A0A078B9J6_STYLE|nr:ringv domain containing protein [Stylonychia lemnae]|eukprot:CDW91099.1 ringv domain containing protein [Stylonychia lemnae]
MEYHQSPSDNLHFSDVQKYLQHILAVTKKEESERVATIEAVIEEVKIQEQIPINVQEEQKIQFQIDQLSEEQKEEQKIMIESLLEQFEQVQKSEFVQAQQESNLEEEKEPVYLINQDQRPQQLESDRSLAAALQQQQFDSPIFNVQNEDVFDRVDSLNLYDYQKKPEIDNNNLFLPLEEEKDKQEEEKIDSNETSPRSIPDEHDLSVNYEDHYLDNYMCLLKGITWGRESHGLFDYGTRHPLKKQMRTDVEQTLVRTLNNDLFLVPVDTDLRQEFDKQAQPLLNIRKNKNKYYLEALSVPRKDDLVPHIQSEVPNPNNPLLQHLNNIQPQPGQPVQIAVQNLQVNNNNNAQAGDQQNNFSLNDLPDNTAHNCDVRERMYQIVRSTIKDEKNVLGRVLFKVLEMRIDEIEQQKEFKQFREHRRNKNYKRQQQKLIQERHITDHDCQLNNQDLDKSVESLMILDQLESCLECLEGEQNYQNIECLIPESSIKIKLKDSKKEPSLIQIQQQTKAKEKVKCNEDSAKSYQQQPLQSPQKTIKIKRAKSGGRQLENREKVVINFDLNCKNINAEDAKEEESLKQQNEQAITKMDPNEINDVNSEGVDKDSPLCRFCWGSEISIANPLLSSCKCNGGIRFIHYCCLKEWLNTKRSVKEQSTLTSYYYKSFECELCKTPYPLIFKAKNRRYNLVDSNKMTGNYLVLESLTLEQNLQRIVHVIQPTTFVKSINLGRGHDSDLRINDISVSRCHATIKFKKDAFYLKDGRSKFGTLVLIKHKLNLTPDTTKAVQVGRTVINFSIKKCLPLIYKEGEFQKLNNKDKAQEVNLDQQRAKLMKHLENMQQAEDYIQKQAAEHQRLANGDNFHQRRYFVQQNIHEEEIKIDYDLNLYPRANHLAPQQQLLQNNQVASLIGIRVQDIPRNEENVQQDDDGRQGVGQIGSVLRQNNDIFNLLRRSDDQIRPLNSIPQIQQQNINNGSQDNVIDNNANQVEMIRPQVVNNENGVRNLNLNMLNYVA